MAKAITYLRGHPDIFYVYQVVVMPSVGGLLYPRKQPQPFWLEFVCSPFSFIIFTPKV